MKKRDRIELNITPLIDIVFILFTFFLVATSFKNKEAKLEIKLPETNSFNKYKPDKKSVKIIISNSKISIDKKILNFKDFENKIKIIDKKKILEIRIDENIKYKEISKILNILKKYKLNNISLITNDKK